MRANLQIVSWAGLTQTEVEVVGKTKTRIRIRALVMTRIAGRMRWLAPGETALVPDRALSRAVRGLLLACLMFVAVPASAQSPLREVAYRVSQGAALAAHGADGFSTEYALARGAFHETNPFLLRVTTAPAWFGAFDMGAAAASLWLTSKIGNRTIATIANGALAGFFAGVAVHNTRAIARGARGEH